MEPYDSSRNSIGDKDLIKSATIMKLESINESIKLSTSITQDPTLKNNKDDPKNDETVHSTSSTIGSSSTVQKKCLKDQEGRLSSNTIGNDSENNISSTVGSENLKASESMLSFVSTAATCGSSSSDMTSSEEETLCDPEDISEKHETVNNDNELTQSNGQSDRQYEETDSTGFTTVSIRKVQNESLKAQEGRSSISTIEKDPVRRPENLKASESMLSFISTAATCGSSSPDMTSSEEEQLCDLEDNNEKSVSEDKGHPENPILGLPRTAVKHISHSRSTIFVVAQLDNKSQTIFTSANGFSFRKDCSSLKSPCTRDNLDAAALPSLPNQSLPKRIEAQEFPSAKPLSSTLACFLDLEEPSSNKNPIDVPPLLENAASSISFREGGTSDIFSDCSATVGFHDSNCNQKNDPQREDESVRRKVKPESLTSETESLPTSSSAPSTSDSSRQAERSFLDVSELLKKTSLEEEDSDKIETCFISRTAKYLSPKPWEKEPVSLCHEIESAASTPQLHTESLLKDRKDFFQSNRVDTDEKRSLKESYDRTIASEYLNVQQELLELCEMLMQGGVYEEEFIDYFKKHVSPIQDGGSESSSRASSQDIDDYALRQLVSIKREFDFRVIRKLYEKLCEGASFESILYESKENSAAEVRFQCTSQLGEAEISSQLSDQSTVYSNYLSLAGTLNQNGVSDTSCPSSSEGDALQNGKSATKSFKTHSNGSKETLNVVLMSDSNELNSSVSSENELFGEKTSVSAKKTTKKFESNDEQTGKDGSNVSAEDFDSKIDRIGDYSEE